MSDATRKLLADALELPASERLELVTELLESVEGPSDPDWEAAWVLELESRSRAADTREARGRPWLDVRDRIRDRLSSK
jgi:putative addiction module component (TIGR02574 family)